MDETILDETAQRHLINRQMISDLTLGVCREEVVTTKAQHQMPKNCRAVNNTHIFGARYLAERSSRRCRRISLQTLLCWPLLQPSPVHAKLDRLHKLFFAEKPIEGPSRYWCK